MLRMLQLFMTKLINLAASPVTGLLTCHDHSVAV